MPTIDATEVFIADLGSSWWWA